MPKHQDSLYDAEGLMILKKVSIVIPCYNLVPYVRQAVDSALAQTYSNFEVIVVNDGSTDDSLQVLRQYGSRVKLVDQKNQGLGAARNHGIAKAEGEFILPLDADDWINPNYLTKTVPRMADPRIGIVSTDMERFGCWHDFIRPYGFSLETEMKSNQLPVTSLIRLIAFHQTPGYAGKDVVSADWNLWIDLLKRGWKVAHVPETLFHYRIRPDSMSSLATIRGAKEREQIRKKHPELNWGN